MKMLPRALTEEQYGSSSLFKKITKAWPNATEAERIEIVTLLAFVVSKTYPSFQRAKD